MIPGQLRHEWNSCPSPNRLEAEFFRSLWNSCPSQNPPEPEIFRSLLEPSRLILQDCQGKPVIVASFRVADLSLGLLQLRLA